MSGSDVTRPLLIVGAIVLVAIGYGLYSGLTNGGNYNSLPGPVLLEIMIVVLAAIARRMGRIAPKGD